MHIDHSMDHRRLSQRRRPLAGDSQIAICKELTPTHLHVQFQTTNDQIHRVALGIVSLFRDKEVIIRLSARQSNTGGDRPCDLQIIPQA